MKSLLAFLSSLIFSFPNFVVPKPPPVPTIPATGFQGYRPTCAPGTQCGGPIDFHPYPSSGISVNWGALAPDFTIFMEDDNKPCDIIEHSIQITNHKSLPRPITIRGLKTAEEKNFSHILNIKIYKDNVLIYGPKTLKQFFIESNTPGGVPLGTLAGNSTSTYKIVVDFPCQAGNEYQKAKLVFKLKIGKLLNLPSPCPCTCYQHQGGRFNLGSSHRFVFAEFDEGEKVECNNRFSCATISRP